MAILSRRPDHGNILDIPTPPLQAAAIFIIFFFTGSALIVYGLRVYSRLRTRQWGLDDWMMTFAMMFSLLMAGPFYIYIKLGYFGWRKEDVPKFDRSAGAWWFYVAQLFYNPILALVKASVLLFLLRLGGQKPGVKWVIHGLNAFNALQAVAIFLVALLQCLPISANWDSSIKKDPNTKCIHSSFHVIVSSLTILTDVLVVALPFWIFLGLKMPRTAKIAVIGIFVLGLAVTAVGIYRLWTIWNAFYGPKVRGSDPYQNITITLSVIEPNLAIIAGSAPALRPLFRTWMPSLFGSSKNNKYTSRHKATYRDASSTQMTIGGSRLTGHSNHNQTSLSKEREGIHLGQLHLKGGKQMGHTECRRVSPNGSEVGIVTYNGIIRTTDVRVQFDADNMLNDSDGTSRASSEARQKERRWAF